jgi:hypothetical protein
VRITRSRYSQHHGKNGPGLDDDLEQLAPVIVEVEQVAGQDQVSGAGDRQEFGQAFDHAEDQRLQKQDDVHELLNVQCGKSSHYSGCVSCTFAWL